MTTLQLLLTVGTPSLLIVLTWLASNGRFERIERRLDALDKRFDEVIANGHKDALEIMRSMTALHGRVAVVEAKQGS